MGKDSLFSEIFSKYDKETVYIDRDEENTAIEMFQKSGDMNILEDVYIKRIPTLKIWALRFYYPGLELTIDDFMEELSIVFIKAANKYNRKKGSFNTCLYTFLNNRIKNMKNSTHAKKRRPINYDGPISGILLSLDHEYSNEKSGESTLKEVLKNHGNEEYIDDANHFGETVSVLSEGNDLIKSVFIKLGEGSTLSSILRELKTKKGDIKLSSQEITNLQRNDYEGLKEYILKSEKLDDEDFTLLEYSVVGKDTISYEIEMKETEEVELIQKTIKYLRKNKEEYIKRIKEL